MADEKRGGGGFMLGLVLGAIAGAALALAFAPQSGQQTREQIVDKGIELRDRARETTDDYLSRGREYIDKTRGGTVDENGGHIVAESAAEAES